MDGVLPVVRVASEESVVGGGSWCAYFSGNDEHELVWPLASSSSTSAFPLARRSIHLSVHTVVPSVKRVGAVLGRPLRLLWAGQTGFRGLNGSIITSTSII